MPSFEVTLPAGFIAALSLAATREEVLTAAAEWVPRTIQAGRTSLGVPIGDSSIEIMKLGAEYGTILPSGSVFPIDGSLVGSAFSSGELVKVDDLRDTTFTETGPLLQAGIHSALVGPMMSGGRCFGTINLGDRAVGHYTSQHGQLLGAFARLVGSFLNLLQLADDAERRATFDELTGAMTRRAGLAALEELDRSGASTSSSFIYLDLDNFKSVNDSHGHQIGDEVLRVVAERVRSLLGPNDQLVRLGGDEFLVIIGDSAPRAVLVAETLHRTLARPLTVGSIHVEPRVSLGIAHGGSGELNTFELMGNADLAMYEAKAGSGVVVADASTRQRAAQIAAIDRDLDAAMSDGSLCFHYQPVQDLITGQTASAEALIRWNHADFGWLAAPLIVKRIEATGRLDRFTRWSLRTAADDLLRARKEAPALADIRFGVNFTPRQLASRGYVDLYLATCESRGLLPHDLTIEIVESEEIQVADKAERTLHALHDRGARIALDDFGTGHNELGYFTRLPIDVCKFDRSLVGVMATNRDAHKILKALSAMVRDLGIVSLAEGVESEIEEEMATDAGIVYGQGWHFGRPMPLSDLIETVRAEPGPDPVKLTGE